MKATKERPAQMGKPPRYRERVPEPPGPNADSGKWKLVGRGSGVPKGSPLIGLELDFNKEQSEWIRAEAARTGLSYFDVVKRLVDEARERGSAA